MRKINEFQTIHQTNCESKRNREKANRSFLRRRESHLFLCKNPDPNTFLITTDAFRYIFQRPT